MSLILKSVENAWVWVCLPQALKGTCWEQVLVGWNLAGRQWMMWWWTQLSMAALHCTALHCTGHHRFGFVAVELEGVDGSGGYERGGWGNWLNASSPYHYSLIDKRGRMCANVVGEDMEKIFWGTWKTSDVHIISRETPPISAKLITPLTCSKTHVDFNVASHAASRVASFLLGGPWMMRCATFPYFEQMPLSKLIRLWFSGKNDDESVSGGLSITLHSSDIYRVIEFAYSPYLTKLLLAPLEIFSPPLIVNLANANFQTPTALQIMSVSVLLMRQHRWKPGEEPPAHK